MDHEAAIHPEVERKLHGLIVSSRQSDSRKSVSHMPATRCLAPRRYASARREGEKDEIAAGNESRREAVLRDLDGDLARKSGFERAASASEAHHMILAKAGGPRRSQRQHVLAHALNRASSSARWRCS